MVDVSDQNLWYSFIYYRFRFHSRPRPRPRFQFFNKYTGG